MSHKNNIVHVTHEAVGKIGGIGAVLDGIFTTKAYQNNTGRTILISPLWSTEGGVENRLGEDGEVLYSSIDGLIRTNNYLKSFQHIEDYYDVNIVYGRKTFNHHRHDIKSRPEVILIDVTRSDPGPVNEFKAKLYSEFGIRSMDYENHWEFEQWVRLAPPAIAALKAIGAAPQDSSTVVISHEFMGMPTALAATLDNEYDFKTVFYAHEVATIRRIVEESPGHDTMFYNVMKQAKSEGLFANDVFGDQSSYFKHVMVDASKYCDNILAVGDYVAEELKFLCPEFLTADIDLTYNGIPAYKIGLEEKKLSKKRLQKYCDNLLGFEPDFIFTHVTRLVRSKGLWRDIRVLEHLEKELRTQHKTAVLFVLSTEVSQRRTQDILNMEAEYHWPVAHREGMPDLSGGEAVFNAAVQEFNAKSRNIKIIFINQFGFTRQTCGSRMPADMEFMDIRKGTDVEFGQSIYEPFGIAQLEPLSFGGICVVSNVCGCAGFVKAVSSEGDVKNVIIADYTDLDGLTFADLEDLKTIDRDTRDKIEHYVSEKVALEICARLARSDAEMAEMLDSGYQLAKHMGWEAVAENYVLKSLNKAFKKLHYKSFQIRAS